MARILIADDDRVVRATMSYLLGTKGHEVVEAASGREGLARIASESFDLLIVDIFMPDMDGLETIKRVLNYNSALPILVVSGMTFRSSSGSDEAPDFLGMATKLGAVQSLRKPFRANELLTAVEDCLNDRAAADDVQPDHGQGSFKNGT
ncbi:MAG TPA: response regulator [Xanthobacteraceae bacterium]|nr:response regulator [Xanthobacteraceae bacterium]